MATWLLSLAVRWLMLALAVWLAAELLSGIELEGTGSTLAVAAILGLMNLFVRPILVLFSLPITLMTFGLFLIVINAALLGLTDLIANVSDDIHFNVENIWSAFAGAIIISIVGIILGWFIDPDRIARRLTGERA
jgi:putative membrane protein